MPNPSVASAWLKLSDEQADSFAEVISNIPDKFTMEQFWMFADDYRQYIVDPANATYILHMYSYLWEISDDFEPLHFKAEIKKL